MNPLVEWMIQKLQAIELTEDEAKYLHHEINRRIRRNLTPVPIKNGELLQATVNALSTVVADLSQKMELMDRKILTLSNRTRRTVKR